MRCSGGIPWLSPSHATPLGHQLTPLLVVSATLQCRGVTQTAGTHRGPLGADSVAARRLGREAMPAGRLKALLFLNKCKSLSA